ncbi:MAG: nucleotide exchange factor GrpE [Chromatiaceae bacterium]|nr:nucleotide exchange factor GrpE [Chromatiaceae bacterium]
MADAEAQGEPNPFEGATQAASSASATSAGTGGNINTLLEDARSKADDHWDQLLRSRAEMENLRRRHASELEKAHKYALDSFVKELVGVRDSLELALEAARLESADLAKLREGTDLTLKQLADVMTRFGVERLDPVGEPFNPVYHQAITIQPRPDLAPNSVATVIQKGYVLNGRLVRPAMVIVSSAA